MKPEKFKFARFLRFHLTPCEKIVWKILKKRRLGVKFERQVVVLGWIVDFFCPSRCLVIEIDGGYHLEDMQVKKDRLRDAVMKRRGLTVLRFTNEEVKQNWRSVANRIWGVLWPD